MAFHVEPSRLWLFALLFFFRLELFEAKDEAAASAKSATKVKNKISPRRVQTEEEVTAEEEETDSLPSDIQIRDAVGISLPIRLEVIPGWEIFLGFSDAQKLIKGRMTLNTVYPPEALNFVSNPELVVDVENFATGEKHLMGTINLWDNKSRKEKISASKVYVGDFSQSLSEFEMSCYPFDYKTVYFPISIQQPADAVFELQLVCAGGGAQKVVDLDFPNKTACEWPAPGSYVGFSWEKFECAQPKNWLIECRMKGIRQANSLITAYLWPSIVYSLMGFLAFGLDVKMAMPRIAITMLALVSLTNLRNQVLTLVPSSGDTSWMEEYFLIAVTFMFLNLVGHTTSFYLESLGKIQMQKMANKVNLWGMLSIFCLVVSARLHVRQCELVSKVESGAIVAATSTAVVVVFAVLAWLYRYAFKELFHKIKDLPEQGRSALNLDHQSDSPVTV